MTQPSHEITEPRPTADGTPDAIMDPSVVLTADHITKAYRRGWRRDDNQVLTDANLTIRTREIVGLVGENGSGKSTLMKILVGSLDSRSEEHTSELQSH